ncbi:FAD binding domain-containing protein [Niallia sp.]|uniref:FAD binding domain-containing protein n=1 Tax=Niallia sp. TaxID=2837523 RepID=UPI0028A1288D|nr:FAD binding domain-containing protein [Niallia sp.]
MAFEYITASTIEQATKKYAVTKAENRYPGYYAGGTEIITLRRINQLNVDVSIDIKQIAACNLHHMDEDYFVIGYCITLTDIEELNYFPLLTEVCKEIADRTARNKITVGGNICGNIFYREAVLPFLLTDSVMVLASENGIRTAFIHDVFEERLLLQEGELLVQAFIEKKYLSQEYLAIKVRQQWETGYPLITIAALKVDGQIRVAISGLCPFPFRSFAIERIINNHRINKEDRVAQVLNNLPSPILNDVEGSDEYRLFVLSDLLDKVINRLEGM